MHNTIRAFSWTTLAAFMLAASARAAPLFFDNFDNSFPTEPGLPGSVWPKWPSATDHLNASTNHNHTPYGIESIQQDPEDPYTLANYHDFGAAAVAVTATAWVFEDNTRDATAAQPVNFYVGLYGDSPSGPTANTDYLLLGLSPTFADYNTYGYRSLTGGTGNTGVTRATALAGSADGSRWIKLAIQADSLAKAGQVRFYINDALVGTSSRQPGVSLRYFFMGSQSKDYAHFWYDDVTVDAIPEITGVTVVGGMVTISFISAASELASNLTLVSAATVNGDYGPAADAAITGSDGSYQATVPATADTQFYRIRR